MGVTLTLNSAAQPLNAFFFFEKWLNLKENEQVFQWYNIYCQGALLQQRNNPATSFLTICATPRCFWSKQIYKFLPEKSHYHITNINKWLFD